MGGRQQAVRVAVYATLGGWLGLSVVGQKLFRAPGRRSWWDKLYLLIPDWRFFAPDPGIHDFHLLYRDELEDGSLTPWKEITSVEERRWSHAFWHPHRRVEKCIFDISKELTKFIEECHRDPDRPVESVQVSVPYLTLLAHVTEQSHAPATTCTQFLVSISAGYDEHDEPRAIFLSALHPVEQLASSTV
ncbi:hypothetical protein [Prauserella cavernicola]|uniref:Uncharacterized protein n=1 Tax=Prauserella cavernicola TaxID=2800127 RepID=A0A934QVP9_9PSEU|nr:hypothetical protein [Prauserella cavernicola]MBK1787263.1 hypothetical protein [Prauserella cavernicola]